MKKIWMGQDVISFEELHIERRIGKTFSLAQRGFTSLSAIYDAFSTKIVDHMIRGLSSH